MARLNRFLLKSAFYLGVGFALGPPVGAAAALSASQEKVDDNGSSRFLADKDLCQDVFADVAEKVIPSVVSITSRRQRSSSRSEADGEEEFDPGRGSFRGAGLGSGVLIEPQGYVLTNNHVVEGMEALRVRLSDEREFDAEIVATDKPSDVAIIRLKGKTGKLRTLPIGDSDKLRVGAWVVAVGSPYGLSETVTTGIVSAKGRKQTGGSGYENYIQTDAAINPGNSGGALVNMKGQLVGINTAIVSQSGGYQGIGLAIPSNMARKVVEDLIKDGQVTRGWLGISIQTLDEGMAEALDLKVRKGALVNGVTRDGPGDKAGLKRGDVIVKMEGLPIRDASDLLNQVAAVKPGAEVDLNVVRGMRTLELTAKVDKRDEKALTPRRARPGGGDGVHKGDRDPEGIEGGNDNGEGDGKGNDAGGKKESRGGRIGLMVADLDDQLRRRYDLVPDPASRVVVTGVEEESRAREAGIRKGDVILEANRRSIGTAAELREAVDIGKRKGKVLLLVQRGETTFFAIIRFT